MCARAQLGLCVGWVMNIVQSGAYVGFLLSFTALAPAAPAASGGGPGGRVDLTDLVQVRFANQISNL